MSGRFGSFEASRACSSVEASASASASTSASAISTVLDVREQSRAKWLFDLEHGRAFAQPARGRRDEAHEVVGILRSKLPRQRKVRGLVTGEARQRRELASVEQPLVVHRAIELLDVLLRLVDAVGLGGRVAAGDSREPLRDGVEPERGFVAQPLEDERSMLGEAHALLESPQLAERIASERPVNLDRHERVTRLEDPLADRVARVALGTKSVSSVFGSARSAWRMAFPAAQYVALPSALTRSSGGATRPKVHVSGKAKIPRRSSSEVTSASPQAREPTVVSSTTHGRSAFHASSTAVGVKGLPDAPRRELVPPVAEDADANHRYINHIPIGLRHAPDRSLGHAPLTEHAIDARDDLRAVRQRHGTRVQVLEVSQPKVHDRSLRTTDPLLTQHERCIESKCVKLHAHERCK